MQRLLRGLVFGGAIACSAGTIGGGSGDDGREEGSAGAAAGARGGEAGSIGGAAGARTGAAGASGGAGQGGRGGDAIAGMPAAGAAGMGVPDAAVDARPARTDASVGARALASDPLDYPNAPFGGLSLGNNSLAGGEGWSDSWDWGEPNAQFAISDAKPVTFPGLSVHRKYVALARGEVGRPFDLAKTFRAYATGENLGADGTELWFSLVLRVDGESNDGGLSLAMHDDPNGFHLYSTIWSAGVAPLKAGSRWSLWSSLAGKSAAVASTKPVTVGAATLVVLRFSFQAGSDRIALWIDPPLGSDDPGPPDATMMTSRSLGFKGFGLSSPAAVAIAEPRMGASFAAVTPAP